MTVLEEMTRVMLTIPGPRDSDDEIAAWYERKAHLLERIADEGGPLAGEIRRNAMLAHRHSAVLLAARPDRAAEQR